MGKKRPAEYDQSSDIANYIGGGYGLKNLVKKLTKHLQQIIVILFRQVIWVLIQSYPKDLLYL